MVQMYPFLTFSVNACISTGIPIMVQMYPFLTFSVDIHLVATQIIVISSSFFYKKIIKHE